MHDLYERPDLAVRGVVTPGLPQALTVGVVDADGREGHLLGDLDHGVLATHARRSLRMVRLGAVAPSIFARERSLGTRPVFSGMLRLFGAPLGFVGCRLFPEVGSPALGPRVPPLGMVRDRAARADTASL